MRKKGNSQQNLITTNNLLALWGMQPVDESIVKLEGKELKKFGKLNKKKTGTEETERNEKSKVSERDAQECVYENEELFEAERRRNQPVCRTVHEMGRALVEHENNNKKRREGER